VKRSRSVQAARDLGGGEGVPLDGIACLPLEGFLRRLVPHRPLLERFLTDL
jgi:hypothetical protein